MNYQRPVNTPKTEHGKCPKCKQHTMQIVCVFDSRGPPPSWKKRLKAYEREMRKYKNTNQLYVVNGEDMARNEQQRQKWNAKDKTGDERIERDKETD